MPLIFLRNAPADRPITMDVSHRCLFISRSYPLHFKTGNPKVIWEEPRVATPVGGQWTHPACAKTAMPTADESNHSAAGTLDPHHSTTSMHTISHNYVTKSHWLQWDAPDLPSKLPLPLTISTSIYYTHPSTDPTYYPKPHSDTISRFSTIVTTLFQQPFTLYNVLIESDAAKNTKLYNGACGLFSATLILETRQRTSENCYGYTVYELIAL